MRVPEVVYTKAQMMKTNGAALTEPTASKERGWAASSMPLWTLDSEPEMPFLHNICHWMMLWKSVLIWHETQKKSGCVTIATASFRRRWTQTFWASRAAHTWTSSFIFSYCTPTMFAVPSNILTGKSCVKFNRLFVNNNHSAMSQSCPASQT